jgi:prepilin-type N-terminal cleavage/methylation domain-containing protein
MGDSRIRVLAKVWSLKCGSGFTMIEVIVVIAVLGILAGIAVPRFVGYRALAVERVCQTNRKSAERLYQAFQADEANAGITFDQFLIENFDEVCPDGGAINYVDGKVLCGLHSEIEDPSDDEEPPGGEVPWL